MYMAAILRAAWRAADGVWNTRPLTPLVPSALQRSPLTQVSYFTTLNPALKSYNASIKMKTPLKLCHGLTWLANLWSLQVCDISNLNFKFLLSTLAIYFKFNWI
jgi:hypothetical protein